MGLPLTMQQETLANLGETFPIGLVESDWGGSPQQMWIPTLAAWDNETQTCDLSRVEQVPTSTTGLKGNNFPSSKCDQGYGCMFNGMIAPYTLSLSVRYILWYQGRHIC